jgi:hypothetical protein
MTSLTSELVDDLFDRLLRFLHRFLCQIALPARLLSAHLTNRPGQSQFKKLDSQTQISSARFRRFQKPETIIGAKLPRAATRDKPVSGQRSMPGKTDKLFSKTLSVRQLTPFCSKAFEYSN